MTKSPLSWCEKHQQSTNESCCCSKCEETVQDAFEDLDSFVAWWHKKFKEVNPNWKQSELYLNGQFDEMPYWHWEEDHLVSEVWKDES